MPLRQSFAFFDVDDTLIVPKSMFSFYRFWACELLSNTGAYDLFQSRFVELRAKGASREVLNRSYYRFFAGVVPETLRSAGQTWVNQQLSKPTTFYHAPVVAQLHAHLRQGVIPVFVSGSFPEVLEPIARALSVPTILATSMLVGPDTTYTGEIGTPQTIGQGKADAVNRFLASRQADAANCFGYGDDLSDLPMLEAVGHPCAVGCDTQLAAHASQQNWPILAL